MLQVYRNFCRQIKAANPQNPEIFTNPNASIPTFKIEEDSHEMLITTYHTIWCLTQRPQRKTLLYHYHVLA